MLGSISVGALVAGGAVASVLTFVAVWGLGRLRTQVAAAVLDGLDEAVLVLDEGDRILWSSVEASRLFGVSLEGRLVAELLVEEDDLARAAETPQATTVRMIGQRGELDIAPRWGLVPWRRGACRTLALRIVDQRSEGA